MDFKPKMYVEQMIFLEDHFVELKPQTWHSINMHSLDIISVINSLPCFVPHLVTLQILDLYILCVYLKVEMVLIQFKTFSWK